jgi:hypothetical protein
LHQFDSSSDVLIPTLPQFEHIHLHYGDCLYTLSTEESNTLIVESKSDEGQEPVTTSNLHLSATPNYLMQSLGVADVSTNINQSAHTTEESNKMEFKDTAAGNNCDETPEQQVRSPADTPFHLQD